MNVRKTYVNQVAHTVDAQVEVANFMAIRSKPEKSVACQLGSAVKRRVEDETKNYFPYSQPFHSERSSLHFLQTYSTQLSTAMFCYTWNTYHISICCHSREKIAAIFVKNSDNRSGSNFVVVFA